MPCRCDEPTPAPQDLERALCRARSLIHQMDLHARTNRVLWPTELTLSIQLETRALLAHKRRELANDIAAISARLATHRVGFLGDGPGRSERKQLEAELHRLRNLTDVDLLGGPEPDSTPAS